MALEGKICLALEPPHFDQKDFENEPDAIFVKEVLGSEVLDDVLEDGTEGESSSGDEDDVVDVHKLALNEHPPHNKSEAPSNKAKDVVYHNPFEALADESD